MMPHLFDVFVIFLSCCRMFQTAKDTKRAETLMFPVGRRERPIILERTTAYHSHLYGLICWWSATNIHLRIKLVYTRLLKKCWFVQINKLCIFAWDHLHEFDQLGRVVPLLEAQPGTIPWTKVAAEDRIGGRSTVCDPLKTFSQITQIRNLELFFFLVRFKPSEPWLLCDTVGFWRFLMWALA